MTTSATETKEKKVWSEEEKKAFGQRMKEAREAKKKERLVKKTLPAVVPPAGAIVPEKTPEGNPPPNIEAADINNAFHKEDGYNALRTFTDVGDPEDIAALLIRGDIPDKLNDGHIFVNKLTHAEAQCYHFKDNEGLRRLRNLIAGYCAINGKRIDVTLAAVIGDRIQKRLEEGGNWRQKIHNVATNGFGGNKKEQEGG